MLKVFWNSKIQVNWILGVLLILFFSSLRFGAVLYGIQSGNNSYLSLVFFLMILTPYVLFDKNGRRQIGLKAPKNSISLLYAFLSGAIICTLIYWLGKSLYGNTLSNWFQYIGESYPVDLERIPYQDKRTTFIIFLIIGITFSPFGEEILYRGVIHSSFVRDLGNTKAAVIDSLAFGIAHLAHFGIVFTNGEWKFLLIPSLIWVVLIIFTGLIFNYAKYFSDSILGPIFCHMGFNVLMTYLIFYQLF